MQDERNVTDEFKGKNNAEIVKILDERAEKRIEKTGADLVVALENTQRDFNAGSIVRTANAFGVREVYLIGRRQWNKRGAMATNKYLHVHFVATTTEFIEIMRQQGRKIIALDNVPGSVNLSETNLPKRAVLVFGQEGPGVSEEMLEASDLIVEIEQFGSTRSINVGAAAAIAMYVWLEQHILGSETGDI